VKSRKTEDRRQKTEAKRKIEVLAAKELRLSFQLKMTNNNISLYCINNRIFTTQDKDKILIFKK
jgi:hypothetical protein